MMFDYLSDISFANPQWFWAFTLIPLLILWYVFRDKKQHAEIRFSSFRGFINTRSSSKEFTRHSLIALRILAISLIITAMARPQASSSFKNISTEGIDIVLSIDISGSMLAKDFSPNRLEASKDVAIEFIDNRPTDRIGLVIFSGESFTQCPLTTDHAVIKNLFSSVKTGMIADGTAIGMGLANAVNRLKDSHAKSKVIILLTDGVNNMGSIPPLTAAEIAREFDVRVYTIGVGTEGKALSPVAIYPNGQYQYDYVDVKIDEEQLKKIAEMTGGRYFRATNKDNLKQVYSEIDQLEKTIIEEKSFTNKEEHFLPFLIGAGILLMMEILLKLTVFKSIP